ncbi:hypothetical protein Syun_007257 [Stephania yunnanensis]|uniref:Uncharacterized protein n=1 Tax=Stephania yunnanensis TaxID=152371 RepID=A0AAP0Q281_9MAGN
MLDAPEPLLVEPAPPLVGPRAAAARTLFRSWSDPSRRWLDAAPPLHAPCSAPGRSRAAVVVIVCVVTQMNYLNKHIHISHPFFRTPIFDPPTFNLCASLGHCDRYIEVEGARGRIRYVVSKGMGRTKRQSGRSPTIGRGGRGGKSREGSTVASRVEAAAPKRKRPASSNVRRKWIRKIHNPNANGPRHPMRVTCN